MDSNERDGLNPESFISSTEDIEAVHNSKERVFLVTSDRVLDIKRREEDGRLVESVRSVFYKNVSKADLLRKADLNITYDFLRISGLLSLIGGVLAFLFLSTGLESPLLIITIIGSGLLILLGMVLLYFSEERSPGQLRLELYHVTANENDKTVFSLPLEAEKPAVSAVRISNSD